MRHGSPRDRRQCRPLPEDDGVRVHHTARGILPAIAAHETLGTLIHSTSANQAPLDDC